MLPSQNQYYVMVVLKSLHVRILNRLGAAASLDTVNRLATQVVKKRLTVSVDNIDIFQKYAFDSSLNASRHIGTMCLTLTDVRASITKRYVCNSGIKIKH